MALAHFIFVVGPGICVVCMSGGRIGIGYGAIPVWVSRRLRVGLGIGIDPVVAVSVHIDVGVVAPSAAMVLKNVPARSIGIEPSLVPARE